MSNRLTSCPKDRRAELAFDTPTDSITEFLTEIDGVPVLVRFVVANMPATMQSDFAVGDERDALTGICAAQFFKLGQKKINGALKRPIVRGIVAACEKTFRFRGMMRGVRCADPKRAATTRREFIERHADSGVLVLAAHFPKPGYIVRESGGTRFVPAP